MRAIPWRRAAALFLPLAVAITLGCGLLYAVVQQDLRLGANDPQQQLAQDTAAALNAGGQPTDLAGGPTVDLAVSLAPFVAIDDAGGRPLSSNGQLDGQPPMPPPGVLAAARESGLNLVTWQPRAGLRYALAVVPWDGGTVIAGRSLRLAEERTDTILRLVGLGWFAILVAAGLAAIIAARIWHDTGEARQTGPHGAPP